MKRQIFVGAAQAYNCDFSARAIAVSNPTGQPFYVRVGGTDAPDQNNASLIVAPTTYQTKNISPARNFGFNLGTAVVPFSSPLGLVMVEFYDKPINEQTNSINTPNTISQQLNFAGQPTLTQNTDVILITPPIGRTLLLFSITVELDINVEKTLYFFKNASAPFSNVFAILPVGTTAAVVTAADAITTRNWYPNGRSLAVNDKLGVINFQATTSQVFIIVDYSII